MCSFYWGAVQISIEGVWQGSSAHARPEGLRTRRFRGYRSGGVEKTTAPTSASEAKNMANMTCRKMRHSAHSRLISETACDFYKAAKKRSCSPEGGLSNFLWLSANRGCKNIHSKDQRHTYILFGVWVHNHERRRMLTSRHNKPITS